MTVLINDSNAEHEGEELDWRAHRRRRCAVDALRKQLNVPHLPPSAIAAFRPHAAALSERISTRIWHEVSAFADSRDPRVRESITRAISGAVDLFLDLLADVPSTRGDVYAHFRQLGRLEGLAGHDLDAMRAAHHIATQECWDELRRMTTQLNLSAAAIARLTDVLLAYQRQLIEQSMVGFAKAGGDRRRSGHDARARLLVALLTGDEKEQLDELAAAAEWPLPDRVVVAVADLRPAVEVKRLLEGHENLLAGTVRRRLTVVADADLMAEAARDIADKSGQLVTLSWAVPLHEVRDAYRWASRTLDLAAQGVIAPQSDGILSCADHQNTLLLHADPALRRHASEAMLVPLLSEPSKHRLALAETMLSWLQTRESAPALAEQLGVHDQTVRNRLRRIKALFHDQLADPAEIINLLTALESLVPRWRDDATSPVRSQPDPDSQV